MLPGKWTVVLACGAMALLQEARAQQTSSQQTPPMPGQPAPGQQTPDARPNGSGNASTPRGASGVGTPGGGMRGEGSSGSGTLSGRVVLSDGAEPGGRIVVQRVCGQRVTGEATADANGRFLMDRVTPRSANPISDLAASTSDSSRSNCELRASVPGYRSDPFPLDQRHSAEGDIGVLVLRRAGPKQELTVSATWLLAPKEAHKSYDKGLEAIRRNRPDEAQKDFSGAVQLYPRFAAAWLELGKVYEQRGHLSDARKAYGMAITADAEYVYSYERLYRLDVRESKWQEAAETTAKVLRLNPYEFPEAFYFNAVSNLKLDKLDAAERSAREVVKLEGAQAEPRGNYVLGAILWRKGDLDGAEERILAFLDNPQDGPEWESARKMLASIESQITRRKVRAAQQKG